MLKHTMSSEDWQQKSVGQKGFTLIELLVVIVILGILAAVVVLAIGQIQDRGQDSACDTEERVLETAIALYYDENRPNYPSDEADLDPFLDDPFPTARWTLDPDGEGVSGTGACS